jgi:hypothetical protein
VVDDDGSGEESCRNFGSWKGGRVNEENWKMVLLGWTLDFDDFLIESTESSWCCGGRVGQLGLGVISGLLLKFGFRFFLCLFWPPSGFMHFA